MKYEASELGDRLRRHLETGILPFWQARCLDLPAGGYRTNFDAQGRDLGTQEKYLNTQCRILWGFSRFHRLYPHQPELAPIARAGFEFLLKHFWDPQHGGWYWKVRRDGSRLDDGKVVYGQSFAIYALAEYARSCGDASALEYAARTFDLLQRYCADTRYGGYYENLEPDWSVSTGGVCAGDRKGLDTHMHLMEAMTTLAEASGREIHRRKLAEVIDVIVTRMIDPVFGCGRNQFTLDFTPVPAIAIRRTWNAERKDESPAVPTDTTSYGHNVELAWLLRRAVVAAGLDLRPYAGVIRKLLDHTHDRGVDWDYGGIYRDGTASGPALVLEKEFWQHAESLVGFLEGYDLFRDPRYLKAAATIWEFVDAHMINHEVGEWRTLLDRQGHPLDAAIGNPWKVCYHTGRAMVESVSLLETIAKEEHAHG